MLSGFVERLPYITDGENGFLVENDPEQWAQKIENIINAQNTRVDVSTRSMEWVNDHYDPERNVHRYIEQFGEIACRR